MNERNVIIDISKCLTQNGFIVHLNDVFCFPDPFWKSVNVVDSYMQDLSWLPEKTINITLINIKKAKKKPNDGTNHGLKWAIDRLELYRNYWSYPSMRKEFHIIYE
jgi:hypothetical protein